MNNTIEITQSSEYQLQPCLEGAQEISIVVDGRSLRVFPYMTSEGHLAMQPVGNLEPYTLLDDGRVIMKPRDFVMPDGLPDDVKAEVERTFILSGPQLDEATALFEAFSKGQYTVQDSWYS
jgi:hypothetical protein